MVRENQTPSVQRTEPQKEKVEKVEEVAVEDTRTALEKRMDNRSDKFITEQIKRIKELDRRNIRPQNKTTREETLKRLEASLKRRKSNG